MYLSSKNFAWDIRYIGLVVSHNSVNDGDHLPAGVAHGRHVGLPFISFFSENKDSAPDRGAPPMKPPAKWRAANKASLVWTYGF